MSSNVNQESKVFPRNMARKSLIMASKGDGAWIVDQYGERYLDASGGAFVSILGHQIPEVAEKISHQIEQLNFCYSGDFTSPILETASQQLIDIAPDNISHAILTTSGSTANEAAIKLARQYHIARGNEQKSIVISRMHSYHGSTLGALSMTGSMPRRKPFTPNVNAFPKVAPPNTYRNDLGLNDEQFMLHCANEFEQVIKAHGSEYISAIILEPIAGSPLGALVSEDIYLQRVREICNQYDVLLIIDEVVSGMGRSGDWFAIKKSGVRPDIITLAKGLGGGYIPVGAVLCDQTIYQLLDSVNSSFVHSESFTGHILGAAAVSAVIEYISDHHVLERVKELSVLLHEKLSKFYDLPLVGTIRGRGVLFGIEFVVDKTSKVPFPRSQKVAEGIAEIARNKGVVFITGNAAVDGVNGDTIMISPPYTVSDQEVELMLDILYESINQYTASLDKIRRA